jgi:hypothetical protein
MESIKPASASLDPGYLYPVRLPVAFMKEKAGNLFLVLKRLAVGNGLILKMT